MSDNASLKSSLADTPENANEGALVVPTTIITQNDLVTWIKANFPNLLATNITQLLTAYPSSSSPVDPSDPKCETNAYGPGTAVNISQVGTGQQQRAYVSLSSRNLNS